MTTKIAPAPGQQLPPLPMGDLRSSRACDYCRNLKVRCIAGNGSSGKCQRCAKSDRDCVLTAPQKRKQRKRTDTRVAELEREVRAMQAAFSQKDGASHQTVERETFQPDRLTQDPPCSFSSSETPYPWGTSGLSQSFLTGDVQSSIVAQASTPLILMNADVLDRGVLSMASAVQLFHSYTNDLVPHYPLVVFPQGYTAAELRCSKPTLFLAVIAAASGKSDPELSTVLKREVLHAYATRTFMNSEKSLELVQAMIVTSVWYNTPNGFGQLKFYEYIHMAATMALDIGLGTKPETWSEGRHSSNNIMQPEEGDTTPLSTSAEPDADDIENMRTYLACYLICAGVSVSMRRSNLVRFNSWTNECMELLKKSSYAAASDDSLIAWVKLVKIAEEIGTLLSYDDPANIPAPSNPRGKLLLKNFEKELGSWKRETSSALASDSIMIMLHHSNIYLHEIALHADHAPEDFKPPYQVEHLRLSNAQPTTAASFDPITECIKSAHSLVDVFLNMDLDALQAVPVFTYVRMSYALFILAKLHVSASNSSTNLGDYIELKSLKLGLYLDATITRLGRVVERKGCKVPTMFLRLLTKFQTWYRNLKARLEPVNEKDKLTTQIGDLNLQTQRQQKDSSGPLSISEYMLVGTHPFAEASPDLEKQKSASTMLQYPTDTPNWNANAGTGSSESHIELAMPNAGAVINSTYSDTGPSGLTGDFQYNPATAFDEQMDIDFDFFSLIGGPDNTGGDLGGWLLPTSNAGDTSDDHMHQK